MITSATQNGAAATARLYSSLTGKRAAMVVFSSYPSDPRPRRAIDAMISEGMTVDLLCLADDNAPESEHLGALSVRRIPIEHRRGGKISYVWNYAAFIISTACILAARSLRKRYDLVYVNNMPDILVASALFPKLLGARVILDLHDPMPELMTTIYGLREDSFAVRAMKWLERWSIARAHQVITVNIACRRLFGGRSCDSEKIGVVMNSPDEQMFPLREADGRAHREGAGNPFVLMYHGSLVERNGLDLAVEALDLVRARIPMAVLRVYGKRTPFLDAVLEDVDRRGMQDCVKYLGPRKLEDLAGEIGKCSVGVVPNHRSAFADINTPTRIFEYLSVGKPVIAPDTKGILDYFTRDSLLFFEAGNARQLAERIEEAYRNPSELSAGAVRAQQVYAKHRWQEERETLLNLVDRALRA